MNRPELIACTKARGLSNLSGPQLGAALFALETEIASALAAGETVRLAGFGEFSAEKNAARLGRNPSNGTAIEIPEKRRIKFHPFKALRESVSEQPPGP